MKRLSLLAIALMLLFTASGCCCGMLHGGCNPCCNYGGGGCYQPSCAPAPCSSCPTCPNGGCGVQGPVIQQGAYIPSSDGVMQASASPAGTPTLASADSQPTF